WLKTLYRKRAVTWPFIFYTIIWTLSCFLFECLILYEQRNDENVFSNILQNVFYFYVAFLSKI
ncbi:sodium transporter, partial [Enterococcus faecium]